MGSRLGISGVTWLAVIVTAVNAVKPVLVDDTAYLIFARHIAAHPLDPYGFDLFWFDQPRPAMAVLCPPVLPYWLALGIRLFGEHPAFLKLWLFPFVWVFAWSVRELLRRFARGTERAALPLIVLSPAVLPLVNLMLDVPAVALALAALVLFLQACERGSGWRVVAAGGVAALAMQTKYTALLAPPVIAWYGLTHRRIRFAVRAVLVAFAGFAVWESLLFEKYGTSHFLFHLHAQPAGSGGFFRRKAALFAPLVGHLGCLGFALALYAGRALGLSRRGVFTLAGLWVVGVVLVAVLPRHDTIVIAGKEAGRARLTLAVLVWRTAGAFVLLTAAGCAIVLLRRGSRLRGSRGSVFVVGWVLLEIAGYFQLSPFPAARRVVGLTVVLGILAARIVSRMSRAKPLRVPPRWVMPFGVAAGVFVAAIDTYDAFPEKVLAERAAEVVRERAPAARVWYAGHWGFQYYCERAGMMPVVPGVSVLMPGDYLVLPLIPDRRDYYRPNITPATVHLPADAVEWVAEFVWNDYLSAQTIPNFYGGAEPILGRDHPRLRVAVYRFRQEWSAVGQEPE